MRTSTSGLILSVPSITPYYVTPVTELYEQPDMFCVSFDRASLTSATDWTTSDGKNTRPVREQRARILEFILRRVRFKWNPPKKYSAPWWKE